MSGRYKGIAKYVRQKRNEAGLSQRELGIETGLGRDVINDIEQNRHNAITLHQIEKLAKALNTTPIKIVTEVWKTP